MHDTIDSYIIELELMVDKNSQVNTECCKAIGCSNVYVHDETNTFVEMELFRYGFGAAYIQRSVEGMCCDTRTFCLIVYIVPIVPIVKLNASINI